MSAPTHSNESNLQTIVQNPNTPAREPEVWDERIPAFNPLFSHVPEQPPIAVSPQFAGSPFDITDYLAQEHGKDLLRFSTAGSVDDGKSTLIGRLLYDTQSVYDDQLQSIEGKGTTAPGVLDLALLTDGLRAEREQGITIDVAYRYFSTPRRKFIIADTPGHEQYTRNMATGASTADVAIVLIDARKGVLPQSRRHAYITALLGVRHVIVAVNKMDLVGYAEDVFRQTELSFTSFFTQLGIDGGTAATLYFVPVSALAGDNVAHTTAAMPWYTGPALLELLETIPSAEHAASSPFRLAVQRVIRPNLDFRGFAGQIASGTVKVGDTVVTQPSGRSSQVEKIVTFDGELQQASAPLSITLTLADEIDISRGDLLVTADRPASVTSSFRASMVWMDATALELGRRYLLKHMSRTVHAQIRRVLHTVDLRDMQQAASGVLQLNGIGLVELELLLPLAVDLYADNRRTGSFVLIDPQSNATVAAGMVRSVTSFNTVTQPSAQVTSADRIARFGHAGAHLHLQAPVAFARALERALFDLGANPVLTEEAFVPPLVRAGLLAITCSESVNDSKHNNLQLNADGQSIPIDSSSDTALEVAIPATLKALRTAGILQH